jgi:hypothetical protein
MRFFSKHWLQATSGMMKKEVKMFPTGGSAIPAENPWAEDPQSLTQGVIKIPGRNKTEVRASTTAYKPEAPLANQPKEKKKNRSLKTAEVSSSCCCGPRLGGSRRF